MSYNPYDTMVAPVRVQAIKAAHVLECFSRPVFCMESIVWKLWKAGGSCWYLEQQRACSLYKQVDSACTPKAALQNQSGAENWVHNSVKQLWLGITCRWFYLHHRSHRMLIWCLRYKLQGLKQEPAAKVASEELEGSQGSADCERRVQTIVSVWGELKIRGFSSLKIL